MPEVRRLVRCLAALFAVGNALLIVGMPVLLAGPAHGQDSAAAMRKQSYRYRMLGVYDIQTGDRYHQTAQSCGVLLFWSRERVTHRGEPPRR